MKNKVYITDYVDNPTIEKEVLGDALASEKNENIEVLLVWHEHITESYIAQFPNLKGVVRYGVGYDAIDIPLCTSKGITVCNTPDYGTDEVSDTAIAMITNIARGVTRYDYNSRLFNDGTWQENTLSHIKRNCDVTVGVLGAGRIGGSTILKAKALGFKTVIYDKYASSGHEKMLGAEREHTLDEFLKRCDIISVHVPLSDETAGIVNESFIAKMKNGASLVNTARGGLISDVNIFYEPLKSGKLADVALDVIPEEPPSNGKMIDAWKARESWLNGRFIINPHSAYFSDKAYFEMRNKAATNALRILNGETPLNKLN